ncbi:MAG: 4-hydroxy-2-oxovalerate aldolase [Chlorobiota bacterium]|nr:MAG: 4-hydroxy-2-oxovalerate aldolase [Chlorobiota bacterium]
MEKKVIVNDVTLRDGMHALSHQYTIEQMVSIAKKLDEAKIDIIEVSHGDGLNGNSINYGFSKHAEIEYLQSVKSCLKYSKLAALLLPGIGTIEDLEMALEAGVNTIRIATHCTEADISKQHIEKAKQLGFDTVGFLMMSHMIEPKELLVQAKKMESYGADCVYITDSAGAMLMSDTKNKVSLFKNELLCEVGFHNHNNLGLGVANSIISIEQGVDRIDASLAGMGAGAGNCALECLIAVMNKMGLNKDIDLYPLIDAADKLVRPIQIRPVQTDGNALLLGYAGVYSSFLLHTERASKLYNVDSKDILIELGKRKMIGGQEDMIVDIALDLLNRNNKV